MRAEGSALRLGQLRVQGLVGRAEGSELRLGERRVQD